MHQNAVYILQITIIFESYQNASQNLTEIQSIYLFLFIQISNVFNTGIQSL